MASRQGFDEFSGQVYDVTQPLVKQPGEGWEYGVNIDWAGVLVERATGLSLNDYIHQHIFRPLDLTNISMFPTKSMKANLAYMNYRSPDGQLHRRDHLHRRPLIVESAEDIKATINSGGAGCCAKPQEYAQILAALLNDGTSPRTGKQILRKETVDEMFRNQIPQFPDFGRQGIPASKPDLTNAIPELYPAPPTGVQGWVLSSMLTGGLTGRSAGTGHWAGLANLGRWCDWEKGVAGFICTQVLPFADAQVLGLWVGVEQEVYKALASPFVTQYCTEGLDMRCLQGGMQVCQSLFSSVQRSTRNAKTRFGTCSATFSRLIRVRTHGATLGACADPQCA